MNELVIPDAAKRDDASLEMARVWIAEHGLHCSLRIGVYADRRDVDEVKAWGIILADLARHAANGLATGDENEPDRMLQRLQESFLHELSKPTSPIRGGFVSEGE